MNINMKDAEVADSVVFAIGPLNKRVILKLPKPLHEYIFIVAPPLDFANIEDASRFAPSPLKLIYRLIRQFGEYDFLYEFDRWEI